ncbi:hypothetical protein NEDG_02121 [Nematocida displodere]|uniref:Uncharacterized protein n=1 Tax=Nematocida displodere TaxID=1805483 RepID=A0A177ED56_9MICR|nr:hypothetical protein NEDG_01431 [Nematocida displodere]OAG32254.1 hypothetical protein NEDG_02121 [Nematocida displodere]
MLKRLVLVKIAILVSFFTLGLASTKTAEKKDANPEALEAQTTTPAHKKIGKGGNLLQLGFSTFDRVKAGRGDKQETSKSANKDKDNKEKTEKPAEEDIPKDVGKDSKDKDSKGKDSKAKDSKNKDVAAQNSNTGAEEGKLILKLFTVDEGQTGFSINSIMSEFRTHNQPDSDVCAEVKYGTDNNNLTTIVRIGASEGSPPLLRLVRKRLDDCQGSYPKEVPVIVNISPDELAKIVAHVEKHPDDKLTISLSNVQVPCSASDDETTKTVAMQSKTLYTEKIDGSIFMGKSEGWLVDNWGTIALVSGLVILTCAALAYFIGRNKTE